MVSQGEMAWTQLAMRDQQLLRAVQAVGATTNQAGRFTPDAVLRNLAMQIERVSGVQNFIEPTQNFYNSVRACIDADGDGWRYGINDAALLLQQDLIQQAHAGNGQAAAQAQPVQQPVAQAPVAPAPQAQQPGQLPNPYAAVMGNNNIGNGGGIMPGNAAQTIGANINNILGLPNIQGEPGQPIIGGVIPNNPAQTSPNPYAAVMNNNS